ncbi:hypothetical protein HGRIS_001291 [Hohenbuehelia grisea]|uniref:Uncharacterized protein n=1 Tax=Hohenbuehelia grisea TaxID=104357 RepID=A0ABR3IPH7_9AGAR
MFRPVVPENAITAMAWHPSMVFLFVGYQNGDFVGIAIADPDSISEHALASDGYSVFEAMSPITSISPSPSCEAVAFVDEHNCYVMTLLQGNRFRIRVTDFVSGPPSLISSDTQLTHISALILEFHCRLGFSPGSSTTWTQEPS